ncbi:MAG: DNA gyrase subunit A, partial [Clostridia bacterium]|nr:DNA gyrase subunit A [Clostridia bacterium]
IDDLIPQEECVLTLTTLGYIKRQPVEAYHLQRRGGKGVKGMTRREEDIAETMFTCNTHDYIMFFTNFGKVYKMKCYEVPEGSRTSKGMNIVNLLPLASEEKVTSMIRLPDLDDDSYLCMVTRQGVIKRTKLSLYNNVRKGGIIAVSLDEGDELAWVQITDGESDLLVATRKGMCIRFNENDARSIGRTARGVRAIQLGENDEVVGMAVLSGPGTILTVSETGYGRRSEMGDFRVQSRGGKGVINYRVGEYGDVAAVRLVQDDEEIILISSDGIIIRVPANEISVFSRPAKGVRVMRLDEGQKLVTLTTTAASGEDEGDDAETAEGAPATEAAEATTEE